MKSIWLPATAVSLGLAAPAVAQDSVGHDMAMPTSPTSQASKSDDASDGARLDHGAMDHMQMDQGADSSMNMTDQSASVGSGTARLPANETMTMGLHIPAGDNAMLMLHGYLWGVYTKQTGPRGEDKFYAQTMVMAEYERELGGASLTGRAMMSLEPAMRHDGYPNLFATGEVAYGQPLVDRQHPHDLFMELSARLDIDIDEGMTVFLYGGPVAEPAIGPSAFMHRASAHYDPEAPITHHWFDSTHITYGVVTAGISAPRWQIEASGFRGREPDEFRWNIETPKLDSWSVRASVAPSPAWLLQASYAQIKQPEAQHPGEDEHRATASLQYNDGRGFAAMAAVSAKDRLPGKTLTALLAEANWDISDHHTVFGRIENVANDELFPDHANPLHDRTFRVTKLQAGYAYRIPAGPFELALGGTLAGYLKPTALDAFYGRTPVGYTMFARLSLGS